MKKTIQTLVICCISLISITLSAQDISNFEKEKLEQTAKQMVVKEVNTNPAFDEFRISNSTPVEFEEYISQDDYSHITDKNHFKYGIKKGEPLMRVTFYNGNDEEQYVVIAIILLKESKIQSMLRADGIGLSGNLLLNKK